jgi:hypothetical protein
MDFYERRDKGHISSKRIRAFEGMSAELQPNGSTILSGFIQDQSVLHAILRDISDLGLKLLLVECKESVDLVQVENAQKQKSNILNGDMY